VTLLTAKGITRQFGVALPCSMSLPCASFTLCREAILCLALFCRLPCCMSLPCALSILCRVHVLCRAFFVWSHGKGDFAVRRHTAKKRLTATPIFPVVEVTHLDYTRKAERISLEILALTSRGHFLCLDFWARWAIHGCASQVEVWCWPALNCEHCRIVCCEFSAANCTTLLGKKTICSNIIDTAGPLVSKKVSNILKGFDN
jgi:hypothetical protein